MRLLERVGVVGRHRRLARNTIDCYARWVAQFLGFHREAGSGAWRHPRDLHAEQVGDFLAHLACGRRLSASSQE